MSDNGGIGAMALLKCLLFKLQSFSIICVSLFSAKNDDFAKNGILVRQ